MASIMFNVAGCILLLVRLGECVLNASATPLSITPSEFWEGDDGWWSTFWIEVGTPPQTLKVLPATSASAGDTTVVIPQGCTLENPTLSDCENLRGNIFDPKDSTSWTIDRPGTSKPLGNNGLFRLLTIEERKLGLDGNAYYGFDTIQLGLDGAGLPTIKNQVVAGIATNDFWIGSLGLSPFPFNFTDLGDPIPSLLSTLSDEGHISNIAWAYTAGAHYADPPAFGSLTLGGYDDNRFDSAISLTSIPFGADISRDLLVELQTIEYQDSNSKGTLSTETIYVFIDSLVTQLWLPVDACKRFEQVFNLTWNATAESYFVSEEVHSALVARNPSYTFTLGSHGSQVDIRIPYAAFDLNMTEPLVQATSRYFPLKRAQDPSQYTLGRVFLQETYVIADYARSNFTIAQARHPPNSGGQNLVTIAPPGATESATSGSSGGGLSTGATVGIVVVAVALAVAVALGLWLLSRRRRNYNSKSRSQSHADTYTAEKEDPTYSVFDSPELEGTERFEAGSVGRMSEMQAGKLAHELDVSQQAHELEGTPVR